jgi:spermidine synthase
MRVLRRPRASRGGGAPMKRFEALAEATAPDGTVLSLHRHDGAYFIRVNGVELMSTRRHHSEDRLAELVCAPLAGTAGARVLVGGLGLGFTLRAALGALAADASVLVVEIVAAVIAWNARPDWALAGAALEDPRVTVRHDDVARVLAASPAAFDGIMLDVDNGAAALTTAGNARLYRDAGIRTAAAALRPGGRLGYWSADPDPAFADALRRAGLVVEQTAVRAHVTTGARHLLSVARPADAVR